MPRFLQRVVDVRAGETRALLWSCVYFFCLLSAYYIIRPLRDEMGVAGGVWNLPWLFTGTLAAMLLVHPPFAYLVTKLPRTRFVTLTYRFFMLCLALFFVLLKFATEEQSIWIGRVFYIWTAVFSLFIVSIFWGFMADTFSIDQGKRLFGFIGLGGTLGGIAGSSITTLLAARLGPVYLLLISIVLLEAGVQSVRRLARGSPAGAEPLHPDADALLGGPGEEIADAEGTGRLPDAERLKEQPIGGRVFGGISHLLRSPYLLGIAGYIVLYTILSTVLYMQQADIADRIYADRALRTAFFAKLDLTVNVLTLLTQFYLTGRIIRVLGVGMTLALLPLLSVFGFAGLGVWPTLTVFVVFQVVRRAGNYAVAKPTRETLYTVVSREDKFKAKNFIDTFVYRAGDQVSIWSQWLLHILGLSMAGIAFASVPIAGTWLLIGLWLGKRQAELAKAAPAAVEPTGSPAR